MTKFVAISDTHGHSLKQILEGVSADVLLIAGDITNKGTEKELEKFRRHLLEIREQFRDVVWIAGNHELQLDPRFGALEELAVEIARDTRTYYLKDSAVVVQGVKIFGSPFTPEFGGWAFAYERPTARWSRIPACDVLLTHGPPSGILDGVSTEGGGTLSVGCERLRETIFAMASAPRVVVFGHIHSGYGSTNLSGIEFFNAAICDEQYKAVNKPHSFTLQANSVVPS